MATDLGGHDVSVLASADLSSYQFYAVTMETSGKMALADSAGEKCIGILQSKPDADGKVGRVRINGTSQVVVDGAVEEGAELSAAATGMLTGASAGHYIVAVALEPGTDSGDQIRAMVVNYQKNS